VRDPELKKYYERLELQPGASFEEIKSAYRRLMRRYHPDLHVNKSPEKQRAAHDVSAALTQAYNELEKVLGAGRK
jgi:curved DNA-binding protein CbpA